MAESAEGKFLETSKNYIKVISREADLVGTVSIDNFTEISVNIRYVDDAPVGIKCKFGKIEYDVTLVKTMNDDETKFDYGLLKLIVMDRLHMILNEKFFAKDYVEQGILFTHSDYFGEVIVLDLDTFIFYAINYAIEKEKSKKSKSKISIGYR